MKQKLPPGPRYPAPVQMVGTWSRPLAFLETCRTRYGKRFTTRFPFSPPLVHHTEPEHIKEIYTAPPEVLHPGVGARVLLPIVGRNSVILLDEGKHMEQRKLMLPAFHGERMERLTDLVRRVTAQEVAAWGDGETELHPRFSALTLEIILRAVFGLAPGERLDVLRENLAALLAYGDNPITLVPAPEDPDRMEWQIRKLNRRGPLRGFGDRRAAVDELLADEIGERRRADDESSDDVLSMLLAARHEDGSPMSAEELRDELMTLLVAGHETTASALGWAFARLARDPQVLAQLQREVDTEDGEAYATATIQETLRRRPVLPITAPRYVERPVEIGGWSYQPGVSLAANAYLLHHDPDIYPDPYSFRPERFLETPPGTYTWIPFGGGRRRCLGASFAQLEMRVVLAEVLRRYELCASASGPELARRRNITVRPHLGTRVRLAARERDQVA